MSQIVLTTVRSLGDLHPLIAIGLGGITVPEKVFYPNRKFQVPETTIFRSN